jgi:hypothetical protein
MDQEAIFRSMLRSILFAGAKVGGGWRSSRWAMGAEPPQGCRMSSYAFHAVTRRFRRPAADVASEISIAILPFTDMSEK